MALPQAYLRGLQAEIFNGQRVCVQRFEPSTDRYDVCTTMGLRAIKAKNVEIVSPWRGNMVFVRGVAQPSLNECFAFAISELDAQEKVVVAKLEDDEHKGKLFRASKDKLRLLPHMPPTTSAGTELKTGSRLMQHFYKVCRQDWGGSNPQQMYDLFGLPSEDALPHSKLTDFRRPPSEAELRAYFGDRVYQGLEMAEFVVLARHNFVEYSFGRQGGYSNNDHTYFLTHRVLRGMIYIAGRGAASHETFSEMSQQVPVTRATEQDGEWYPVIAVQIETQTDSIEIKISIKWRCPAIGAWGSRTWTSSSDRFEWVSASRLSDWVDAARSRL